MADAQVMLVLKDKFEYVFSEEMIQKIAAVGTLKTYEEEIVVMDIGDKIIYMPILISGSIKIMREDKEGREFLLYYLEVGDTCAMTLNCCMGNKKSEIKAVTEEPTSLVFIPVQKMEDWIVEESSWRKFIFESYNSRLMEAIEAIDNLAFYNMEDRIYKYLRDKALVKGKAKIKITHYQIANDLNTSRVVVSRLVKKLAQEGKINHERNYIEINSFASNNQFKFRKYLKQYKCY